MRKILTGVNKFKVKFEDMDVSGNEHNNPQIYESFNRFIDVNKFNTLFALSNYFFEFA